MRLEAMMMMMMMMTTMTTMMVISVTYLHLQATTFLNSQGASTSQYCVTNLRYLN
jgi:hypothetical protein